MFLWFCAYPLITKSEVVRGKSQTEVNTSRPMSKISLYYEQTGEVVKVIYYMAFLRYQYKTAEVIDQLKPTTGQWVSLKKCHLNELHT